MRKKVLVLTIATLTHSQQIHAEEYDFLGSMSFYDASGNLVYVDQTVSGFIDTNKYIPSISYGFFTTQQEFNGALWSVKNDVIINYDATAGGVQTYTWSWLNRVFTNESFSVFENCRTGVTLNGCATLEVDPTLFELGGGVTNSYTFQLSNENQFAIGMFWDWSTNDDIPVIQVWEKSVNADGSISVSNVDSDGDGVPGASMITGPYPGQTLSIDGVLSVASTANDYDADGIANSEDNCPEIFNVDQLDSDGDGAGDACDDLPLDPAEIKDSDGDGVGDNADAFPYDPAETKDSDGDGVGDNADVFPYDPTETKDSDGDGVGDNADAFPNDPTETEDSDSDGFGNNTDNCTLVPNPRQRDTDLDGYGNFCDPDFDGNLVVNAADLAYFKKQFFTTFADADLNGDGLVNAGDLAILKTFYFKAPGPSAIDANSSASNSSASSTNGASSSFDAILK